MNRCPKCNTEFEGKFCPNCGEKWQEEKSCPQCGAKLDGAVKFCNECGYSFVGTENKKQVKESFPKVFCLLKFVPAVTAVLFGLLLFAFYATPVASLILGAGFPNQSLGNVYSMQSGILSEIPELNGALIMLFILLSISVVAGFAFLFSEIKRIDNNKIKIGIRIVSLCIYFMYFIVGIIIVAEINKFDGGMGAITSGACPVLLIVFSLLFALISGGSIIARKMLAEKNAEFGEYEARIERERKEKEAKRREQFYETHSEPQPEIKPTAKENKRAKIVYKYEKRSYDRAKENRTPEAIIWLDMNKAAIITVSIILVLLIVSASIFVPILTNKFRVGVVEKIEIGYSQEQVENILGKPYEEESTDYLWVYYDKNYMGIIEKLEKNSEEQEKAFMSGDEGKLEKLLAAGKKLTEQLENSEYDYIQVIFEKEEEGYKVTSVLLDKGKKNKGADIKKEVKNIEITDSIILHDGMDIGAIKVNAKIYYKDGSYKNSPIPASAFNELKIIAGTQTIKWSDNWGDYEKDIVTSIGHIYEISEDNKYIYFGEYPQSEMTETSLVAMLGMEAGTLPTSTNKQKWTDYCYYIEGKVQSYMWYIDLEYNEARYRGVYFTSYRPYCTTYSSSTDDSYQDANGYKTETTYWFKWEPIRWRILEQEDGKAFLMADLILDSQQYYHEYDGTRSINGKTVYPNNYKESDIRAWLNETFYNQAFSKNMQDIIETTEVDNSLGSTGDSRNNYICENTSDKIFLLSCKEVVTSEYGFSSSYSAYDTARQLKASDYAQCQGAYKSADSSYRGCGWWWLRSPKYYDSDYARRVGYDGYAYSSHHVNNAYGGVVPALQIRL